MSLLSHEQRRTVERIGNLPSPWEIRAGMTPLEVLLAWGKPYEAYDMLFPWGGARTGTEVWYYHIKDHQHDHGIATRIIEIRFRGRTADEMSLIGTGGVDPGSRGLAKQWCQQP